MLPCYLFKYLRVVLLFLSIFAVQCFNEPCEDDTSCTDQRFRCRSGHCLCPADQFWAGRNRHCTPCPGGWINLFIYCIYYDQNKVYWDVASQRCTRMSQGVNRSIRLLEFSEEIEFEIIQRSITQLLTENQMELELSFRNMSLFSAIAFVGSYGYRRDPQTMTYFWSSHLDRPYSRTNPMWCKEKSWYGTRIPTEPAWESDNSVSGTVQALKRWKSSGDGCLISVSEGGKQPFFCEIVGDEERFDDMTIISLPNPTITSTKLTTVTAATIHVIVETRSTEQSILNTVSSLLTSTGPLSTTTILSNTTSIKLHLTTHRLELKQNQVWFIIIGVLGVIILVLVLIIIINNRYQKKELFMNLKTNNKDALSRSKTNKNFLDDTKSNTSSESHQSIESTAQQSQASHRIYTDNQSVTPSKSPSAKQTKLALWDQMESSLFFSNLSEPTKR